MRSLIASLFAGLAIAFTGQAQTPAELFGRDAYISDFEMSPGGDVVAHTRRHEGKRLFVV